MHGDATPNHDVRETDEVRHRGDATAAVATALARQHAARNEEGARRDVSINRAHHLPSAVGAHESAGKHEAAHDVAQLLHAAVMRACRGADTDRRAYSNTIRACITMNTVYYLLAACLPAVLSTACVIVNDLSFGALFVGAFHLVPCL